MAKVAKAYVDGVLVADKVIYANGMLSRMKGLLGKDELMPGEGCFLTPCGSIHCKGMKFPIDVVYVDRNNRVLHVETCAPGSMGAHVKGVRSVLELAAGVAAECGVRKGCRVEVIPSA